MRAFRLLLVLTLLGAPAWAEPAVQEASVEAVAPPLEVGADVAQEQAEPGEDTSAEDSSGDAEAPVVAEEVPPVVEEAPSEQAPTDTPSEEVAPVVADVPAADGVEPTVAPEAPVAEAPPEVSAEGDPTPLIEPTPEPRPARRLRAAPVQAAEAETPAEPPASTPAPSVASQVDTWPMNDLALVAGWNAPSGWGARYLRRIPDTPLAVGAGLAPLTLWGIKLSLIVRRAVRFDHGFFQQVSVGFSTGSDDVTEVLVDEAGARSISLRKTPGRTLDLVLGYRWGVFTRSFAELFTGWSFNFQGTFLQNSEVSKVPIPSSLREELEVQTPGGLVLGVTFGWRF